MLGKLYATELRLQSCFPLFIFEAWSLYIAQAGLALAVLLPQLDKVAPLTIATV